MPFTSIDWWGDESPQHVTYLQPCFGSFGIFYLPSIDTGTRHCQFIVSSEQHSAKQASQLNARPPIGQVGFMINWCELTKAVKKGKGRYRSNKVIIGITLEWERCPY